MWLVIDSCKLHILETWSVHLCLRDSVFEHGGVIKNIFPQLEERIQVLLLESQIFSQTKVLRRTTSTMRVAENCHESLVSEP
ncbi:MAG: hypothetical protein VYE65_02420 [SAR324 cluster bacterium]|nr:hypothetical protein [SAR324 cluster bacterium]